MALWGKTDTLASQPKYVSRIAFFDSTAVNTTAETINILSANTGFATGDAVLYSINGGTVIGGLTDNTTYYVRNTAVGVIELYDTYANAIAPSGTTGRLNITGAGVGTQTLKRVGNIANPFGDSNYNGSAIVFIDAVEAVQAENIARGLTGAGWWLYKQYTDSNSVLRKKAECLVAFNVDANSSQPGTTGDGNDDTVAVDRTITITAQPADSEEDTGSEVEFSVTATVSPTTTITYLWQVSTDGTTWNSAPGTNNAATYTIADNTGLDGNLYRCLINSAGATQAVSDAALLTEVPVGP